MLVQPIGYERYCPGVVQEPFSCCCSASQARPASTAASDSFVAPYLRPAYRPLAPRPLSLPPLPPPSAGDPFRESSFGSNENPNSCFCSSIGLVASGVTDTSTSFASSISSVSACSASDVALEASASCGSSCVAPGSSVESSEPAASCYCPFAWESARSSLPCPNPSPDPSPMPNPSSPPGPPRPDRSPNASCPSPSPAPVSATPDPIPPPGGLGHSARSKVRQSSKTARTPPTTISGVRSRFSDCVSGISGARLSSGGAGGGMVSI